MSTFRIRIAIIGGGLAGASLANALFRIPHIEVQVFESAPEFSERGAAVGLSLNSQLALREILEDSEQLLEKAGCVPMASTRLMIGSGPHAGSLLLDLADVESDPELVVHRASLLRELLAPLPERLLHANKKLTSIQPNGTSVKVYFADGTDGEFDAVIGADGIFSVVRDHVLEGHERKEHSASPAGFWDCRVLVPIEKAKATLGEEIFKLNRQYGWIGDGAFIMHDVLENGTLVQCVISAIETEQPKDRKHTLTREFLMDNLKNWSNGPIADGIINLMLEQDNPCGYSQWEHKTTPKFDRGRLCIVGDAAHATTPWQGAGAGQAFEDAMVLSALFRYAKSSEDVEPIFKTYNAIRRTRCQRVIDSSRGTGIIMCGKSSEAGLDPTKLVQALASRWSFLQLDPKTYIEEALLKLDELRRA